MTPHLRRELQGARELLEIRLLCGALDGLLTALRFEHPMLDEPPDRSDNANLRGARRIASRVRALRVSLRSYKALVRRQLRAAHNDDFPF